MRSKLAVVISACLIIFGCSTEEPSTKSKISEQPLAAAAFNESGDLAAFVDYQGNASLWDIKLNKFKNKLNQSKQLGVLVNANVFNKLLFSKHENLLIGSYNQHLMVWNSVTSEILNDYATNGLIVDFAITDNGNTILVGYNDQNLNLISTTDGKVLWQVHYNNAIEKVAISEDGLYGAISLETGQTDVWHISQNKIVCSFKSKNRPYFLNISPQNRYLLTAAVLEPIKIYDLHSAELLYSFNPSSWLSPKFFKANTFFLNSVAFKPDLSQLIAASGNGELYIWELNTGSLIKKLSINYYLQEGNNATSLLALSYGYDGKYIYAICANGFSYKWLVK